MRKIINLAIYSISFNFCLLSYVEGISYYEQRYIDPTVASQWIEGQTMGTGATKDYLNQEARLPWARSMGDWCDREGKLHGNAPHTVLNIDNHKTDVWSIDVTELVNAWVRNDYPNQGFVLRGIKGSGPFSFYSRESIAKNNGATLRVKKLNGSEQLFAVEADTFLTPSSIKGMGSQSLLSVSRERSALLRFNNKDIGEELLSKAVLNLKTKKLFGNFLQVGVFRVCSPPNERKSNITGIAANYVRDKFIDQDENVVFFANFDDFWWRGQGWSYGYNSNTIEVVGDDEDRGFWPLQGKALRVTVPQDGRKGMDMGFVFSSEGLPEPENLYFRYYLRFSDDWDTKVPGKLPGLSGTYNRAGWGGRKSDGYNGWSARGLYRNVISNVNPLAGRVPVGNYLYHAELDGKYGEHHVWSKNYMGYLQHNRWYSLEQQVKLNTPGKSDGILRAWIDGKLAYENTAINYRKTRNLKIEKVWMNVYHGGMKKMDKDIHLYIDNVVVAKRYIGPMAE